MTFEHSLGVHVLRAELSRSVVREEVEYEKWNYLRDNESDNESSISDEPPRALSFAGYFVIDERAIGPSARKTILTVTTKYRITVHGVFLTGEVKPHTFADAFMDLSTVMGDSIFGDETLLHLRERADQVSLGNQASAAWALDTFCASFIPGAGARAI
jgi:hypothetical protein